MQIIVLFDNSCQNSDYEEVTTSALIIFLIVGMNQFGCTN